LPDNNSAVATRELFYTGITRAAQRVEIWASEASLHSAIERKTERVSGLLDRLRK
jgi:exodeoxyribonuclease V alpha subunit